VNNSLRAARLPNQPSLSLHSAGGTHGIGFSRSSNLLKFIDRERLAVEPQQVVLGKSEAADWRFGF
jgi:hypothetical protein